MINTMSINGEKWIVSLSDGRTLEEAQLCDEPSRISPWGKLEEILAGEDIYITQLRVQVLGRTYSSISRSGRAKYPSSMKPHRYICIRRMGVDGLNPGMVYDHCIGMQVELDSGMKIVTWVDIYTEDSWQQVE